MFELKKNFFLKYFFNFWLHRSLEEVQTSRLMYELPHVAGQNVLGNVFENFEKKIFEKWKICIIWLIIHDSLHMSHCDYDVMIFHSKLFKFDLMTHLARVQHVITYAYNLIIEKDSGIIVNLRNRSSIHSEFTK